MSRTLTSPRRQVSSRTSRSKLPSPRRAISLGRRKPRNKNLGLYMGRIVSYQECICQLFCRRGRPFFICDCYLSNLECVDFPSKLTKTTHAFSFLSSFRNSVRG